MQCRLIPGGVDLRAGKHEEASSCADEILQRFGLIVAEPADVREDHDREFAECFCIERIRLDHLWSNEVRELHASRGEGLQRDLGKVGLALQWFGTWFAVDEQYRHAVADG